MMNANVGVAEPNRRSAWGEYLGLLIENNGAWVEFTFEDPEEGYRLYRRLKSDKKLAFGASVRGKGTKITARFEGEV